MCVYNIEKGRYTAMSKAITHAMSKEQYIESIDKLLLKCNDLALLDLVLQLLAKSL